jgi:DNA polymerase epsilon subunit 2
VPAAGKKCIFGQLCQLTEGVFSLEDIHSSIVVDLRSPSLLQSAGLFTEGCFVVCEGETRDDGVFAVSALISPPPERKMVTVKVHPALDWLGADLSAATSASAAASGGGSVGGGSAEAQLKLKLLRSPQHANDMIVVLSDVFLDLPRTLVRLATLLEGLRTASPQAFVFMGNFTSTPSSNAPGQMARLKAHFDALADVLLKFPSLCREAHFVFIPGPRDLPASLGDVLPSPPLPAFLTQRLRERLAHVTCATNPARLSWVNKELLLFREDLLHRMRRACVRPPAEAESADNSQHLVRTLIDQAHLCPLPMERRPIYWNHDHALRMYPLPDALVLADSVDPYEHKYAGVHALNPGSFGNDGAFVIYYPARGESERVIEFSKTADAAAASAH